MSQQVLSIVLLVLFGVALTTVLFYHIMGIEFVLGWDILAQRDTAQVAIESFKTGPFTLTSEANNPLFVQKYTGRFPEINISSYHIFLSLTTLCLTLLLTAVTTLPRFWYFAGISLFIVVLVNFKFELLLLFGNNDKIGLVIALLLYIPITFYWNAFKPQVSFLKRWSAIITITVVFAVFISMFSTSSSPFFLLSTYGMTSPYIIGLLFLFMIAHELIGGVIYLLTRSATGNGGSNLLHFFIIIIIYLANLLLAYLHETNVIDWDFVYIDLFLLVVLSALVGMWGFGQRENQYGFLFSYKPVGLWVYLAMALCSFVTMAHLHATANDPGLEVFRDFIIYSHLAYGLIFTVYVIANFIGPLKDNLPIYKVLYKPNSMPYFTYRFAGFIVFLAFVFKSNWEVPFNQSASTYYNGLGDYYSYHNQMILARHYYEEAAIFGFRNHKSHYALATLAHSKRDVDKAIEEYKMATLKNPSPQCFVNLGNIYNDQDRFFEALFTLQKGVKAFPHSGELFNNLGLTYSKSTVLDSAIYFINQAYETNEVDQAAGSNLLALLAKNEVLIDTDSLKEAYDIKSDPISINNTMVMDNLKHKPSPIDFEISDSTLTDMQAALLYNIAFNKLFNKDSANMAQIEALGRRPENSNAREDLLFITAFLKEQNKDIGGAFRQLNWLANTTPQSAGKFFFQIGQWAMKQNAPYVASDYFSWAAQTNYPKANLNLAIALTEAKQLDSAKIRWNELLLSSDRNEQIMATTILSVLNQSKDSLATDKEKYLYVRYNVPIKDSARFKSVVSDINSDNYKGQAIYDRVMALRAADKEGQAISIYQMVSDLEISDQYLYDQLQWLQLDMLAEQGNIRSLAEQINKGVRFDRQHAVRKAYYTALIARASGDSITAKKNFYTIAYKNPFYPQSIIAAASYFNQHDLFEAYNILLSALEINPESIKLLKAYILQCALIERDTYAALSLETLQRLVDPEDFRNFIIKYKALREQVRREADNF